MKTLAFYPLHYGSEYLYYSLLSIYNHVDKIVILYSPTPSFGFKTSLKCPDDEDRLRAIAEPFGVQWVRVEDQTTEADHRNLIYKYTDGYDMLLAVDADEVWSDDLPRCLQTAYLFNSGRYNIQGFVHFWKSFDWCCRDGFAPGRIYNLRQPIRQEYTLQGKVYHFGYAQSREIIEYKMSIHGHKSEIRPEWFGLWDNWTPGDKDLHPAAYGVWPEASRFDKDSLPAYLKEHPLWNAEQKY